MFEFKFISLSDFSLDDTRYISLAEFKFILLPEFRVVLTTSELTALSMVCFLERSDLELFIAVASLVFDCAASMISLAFKFISFSAFR